MTVDLPDEWEEFELETLLRQSLSNGKSVPTAEDGFPVLRLTALRDGQVDLTERKTGRWDAETAAPYVVERGDFFVARGNGSLKLVGRGGLVEVVPDPVAFPDTFIRVRLDLARINPRFFAYQWNSGLVREQIERAARTTAGIYKINQQDLNRFRIRVAPRQSQDSIASTLDSYFSRLDDAVADLERAQRNLKRYRASVLKAAVEGRLVPTEAELARAEGRDYEPAPVLLERILAERRRHWEEAELEKMLAKGKPPKNDKWKAMYKEPVEPDLDGLPELPEGWCWASLDQLVSGIEAGKSFRCDERPPETGEVGVVKVSAVTWGAFDPAESKTCTRADLIRDEYMIKPGDLLLSRANTIELVGACVIAGEFDRRIMLSDKILRLRAPIGTDRWLLWCLRSRLGRYEIERLATGNQDSMRNISQSNLRSVRVPLAPPEEAERVLDALEAQMSVAQVSGQTVDASRRRVSALRQSILAAAFSGQIIDAPSAAPEEVMEEAVNS